MTIALGLLAGATVIVARTCIDAPGAIRLVIEGLQEAIGVIERRAREAREGAPSA